MKLCSTLLAILLGVVSRQAIAHVAAMHCTAPPKAIETVVPRLPPILHNEYDGFALVRITIGKSGRVLAPRIVTAQWTAVGHSGTHPIGYNEAILEAIAQWRYPAQKIACRMVQRVTIKND